MAATSHDPMVDSENDIGDDEHDIGDDDEHDPDDDFIPSSHKKKSKGRGAAPDTGADGGGSSQEWRETCKRVLDHMWAHKVNPNSQQSEHPFNLHACCIMKGEPFFEL